MDTVYRAILYGVIDLGFRIVCHNPHLNIAGIV
jgi:hypothetical protein